MIKRAVMMQIFFLTCLLTIIGNRNRKIKDLKTFNSTEKELDLNIHLDDSPLTRLTLLSGYGSFNVY